MAEREQKAGRLGRVVLVISLAINLAVAGLVAGTLISGGFGGKPPRQIDLGLGPVVQALTPPQRREIAMGLRRDGAFQRPNLRGDHDAIVDALTADPFVPDALRAVLQEQSDLIAQTQARAQDALVETVTGMTTQERRAFADRLMREMHKTRRRPSGG